MEALKGRGKTDHLEVIGLHIETTQESQLKLSEVVMGNSYKYFSKVADSKTVEIDGFLRLKQ